MKEELPGVVIPQASFTRSMRILFVIAKSYMHFVDWCMANEIPHHPQSWFIDEDGFKSKVVYLDGIDKLGGIGKEACRVVEISMPDDYKKYSDICERLAVMGFVKKYV